MYLLLFFILFFIILFYLLVLPEQFVTTNKLDIHRRWQGRDILHCNDLQMITCNDLFLIYLYIWLRPSTLFNRTDTNYNFCVTNIKYIMSNVHTIMGFFIKRCSPSYMLRLVLYSHVGSTCIPQTTHKYMTADFRGLIQALPLLLQWCSHTSVFHLRVK